MPFSLLAPVLFGVGGAVVVMVTASTMSAALGFLTARYMAREAIEARLAGTPAARLAALLEEHGWIVIPILRTVPIAPFVVVNYGFGLTRIGFWRYLIWSALGMIPSNVALIMGANLFYDKKGKDGLSIRHRHEEIRGRQVRREGLAAAARGDADQVVVRPVRGQIDARTGAGGLSAGAAARAVDAGLTADAGVAAESAVGRVGLHDDTARGALHFASGAAR